MFGKSVQATALNKVLKLTKFRGITTHYMVATPNNWSTTCNSKTFILGNSCPLPHILKKLAQFYTNPCPLQPEISLLKLQKFCLLPLEVKERKYRVLLYLVGISQKASVVINVICNLTTLVAVCPQSGNSVAWTKCNYNGTQKMLKCNTRITFLPIYALGNFLFKRTWGNDLKLW